MAQLQQQMQNLPGYGVAMDYFNDYMDEHFNKTDPFKDEEGNKLRLPHDTTTKEEQKLWKSIQSQAWIHDQCFMGCGNEISGIGLVPLMVLILPGLGPILMYMIHAKLISMAERKLNIPNKLIGKMQSNIVIDLIITFPPLIGSFFGWLHGCSTRNAGLLYQYIVFVSKERAEGKTATYIAPTRQVVEPEVFGNQPQTSTTANGQSRQLNNHQNINNSTTSYKPATSKYTKRANNNNTTGSRGIVVQEQQESGFV